MAWATSWYQHRMHPATTDLDSGSEHAFASHFRSFRSPDIVMNRRAVLPGESIRVSHMCISLKRSSPVKLDTLITNTSILFRSSFFSDLYHEVLHHPFCHRSFDSCRLSPDCWRYHPLLGLLQTLLWLDGQGRVQFPCSDLRHQRQPNHQRRRCCERLSRTWRWLILHVLQPAAMGYQCQPCIRLLSCDWKPK